MRVVNIFLSSLAGPGSHIILKMRRDSTIDGLNSNRVSWLKLALSALNIANMGSVEIL